jgi:hypothetical protein
VAVFAAGDVGAVPGDDKISSADELQAEVMSRAMVEMKTARIKERRRDGEGHLGGAMNWLTRRVAAVAKALFEYTKILVVQQSWPTVGCGKDRPTPSTFAAHPA